MDWKKYVPYFKPSEFACKCGCGTLNIHPEFMERLLLARKIADTPFVITSGCRCPSHNAAVGGVLTSSHIATKTAPSYACDILVWHGDQRYRIVSALMSAGFERIQSAPARGYLHCDCDPGKARPWFG
jgi:hypothetical protein